MRLTLALLLGLGSGCSLYVNDDHGANGSGSHDGGSGSGGFDLVPIRTIAGEAPVVGIDSDGAGGIWIAYRTQPGDYYALADVWIVHLDAANTKLSEWHYNDEYTKVSGLAFTGDALWLNYNSVGTGNNHLRKLDIATGQRIGSFATETGIIDLSSRDGTLLLSNLWREMIAMNEDTGEILSRSPIPALSDNEMRGIAATPDGIWLAPLIGDQLVLVGDTGSKISSATTSVLDREWNGDDMIELAWDGSALILGLRGQIHWLRVRAHE